jgi:hypothetical protein
MKMRNIAAAVLMAAGTLALAPIAYADKIVELQIGVAPPAERVEVVPAPRPGYIYERGHYVIESDKYVWHEGRFVKEREGHRWQPYVLEKRGEVYIYRPGHWDDEG